MGGTANIKAYLFTYSDLCPPWQAQAILNKTEAVYTWAQPFPNAALLASNLDARDLAAMLRRSLGETWFLITELNGVTVDGYLPGNLWQFINSARTPWQPQIPDTAVEAG